MRPPWADAPAMGMFLAAHSTSLLYRGTVMADSISILGIAGSLRKDSFNKSALRAAQAACPQGARIEVFDLAGIPPFNQDEEAKAPQKVVDLKARIRAADAILLSTPEYNYGMP